MNYRHLSYIYFMHTLKKRTCKWNRAALDVKTISSASCLAFTLRGKANTWIFIKMQVTPLPAWIISRAVIKSKTRYPFRVLLGQYWNWFGTCRRRCDTSTISSCDWISWSDEWYAMDSQTTDENDNESRLHSRRLTWSLPKNACTNLDSGSIILRLKSLRR